MITLGLDLGHTSLAWALADVEKGEILDGGIQIFEAPEDEKHNTLASIRRSYRSSRVTNKNHNKRILNLKKICTKYKLVSKSLLITPKDKIAPLFKKGITKETSLSLRSKGLDEILGAKDIVRIIIHIANRRGFKYEIDDDNDEESGKIRSAQMELKNDFSNHNYRTYGEYLYKEFELKGKKSRNRAKKDKTPDYKFSIHRDDLEDELRKIFSKQKELKNPYICDDFIDEIMSEVLFVNEPKSLKGMIGNCSLIEGEKRASKALYSSEIFVARGILVNLRVKEPQDHDFRSLTNEEIETLLEKGHQEKISKTQAKKILNISNKSKFKGDEEDKRTYIVYLEAHLKLKEAFGDMELFAKFFDSLKLYDDVVNLLTYEKSIKRRKEKLTDLLKSSTLSTKEQEKVFEKLIYMSFSGYLNVSTKAVKMILPYLEKGYRVDQAIQEQDMKIEVSAQAYLPPLKDTQLMIPNPIAVRAITKTRHLINAILKKYRKLYNDDNWTFDLLNIELAREINTIKDKKEIILAQYKDSKNKQIAVDFIVENCGDKFITSKNILKVRLWKQQDENCIYSFKPITAKDIENEIKTNSGAFEVDHILPISRSSDDSISNKVLVLSGENQAKSNKTPFEYFGNDKQKWDKYENYIRSKDVYIKLGKAKVGKLLMRDFATKEQDFLNRHLNDTRIISKTVKNYVEKHLKFQESSIERRVYVVSGKLTSTLRHQWGLKSKNRENHYHHFEDAVLVAFANQSIINRLSKYYHQLETYKKDDKNKPKFTKPYENFVADISSMIQSIDVVRSVKVKNSGKIHSDNPRKIDKNSKKGMKIRGGIADNGEIVRTDVFKEKGKEKYFLIPFYLKDLNHTLPTKFITAGGKEWQEYEPDKQEFIFTLYPNDLIYIETKTETIQGYYISPHTNTANIKLLSMDNVDDGIFTKEIKKYILKISIKNQLDTDSKKAYLDEIRELKIIKKCKPQGSLVLNMDIAIKNIADIEYICEDLEKSYSIVSIENHTKTITLQKDYKNENEIKLALDLRALYDTRATKGTGVKTKMLSFKKLKIGLLGDIIQAPIQTQRRTFTKR